MIYNALQQPIAIFSVYYRKKEVV